MSKRRRSSSLSTPPSRAFSASKPTLKPTSASRRSLASFFIASEWEALPLPRSELSLPLTLPTGQTFRWRCTGPGIFTGVVGHHLISLSHLDDEPESRVAFLLHGSPPCPLTASRADLKDYLNLRPGVSLATLWREFAAADPRLAARFDTAATGGGARVLRQDPVECVFQFLCSSNNNIKRIEKMVGVLSAYGNYLGSVGGFDFHEFPSLERLAAVSEQDLRDAGFGYRAKYVVGAVKELQLKPGGGSKWLASLRELDLPEVIDALCTLPGVGPKVAACIALFSLDQNHSVPVDTHVWKIASRYFLPELASMRPTPRHCSQVAEAFVSKFGKYAGWAQNVLFIGELSSQNAHISFTERKPVILTRRKHWKKGNSSATLFKQEDV